MSRELVRYQTEGRAAWLWLARPQRRNAFNSDMLHGLRGFVDQAAADSDVRVLVLAAEGSSFCSGADLRGEPGSDGGNDPGKQAAESVVALAALLESMRACGKPIVARVQGPVVGGGIGLVAASDVIIATPNVTLAMREVRVGAVPAVVMVPLLERLSVATLRELMLTARVVNAAQALALGLIHHLSDELDADVAQTVEDLVAGAPGAQASTKQLLNELTGLDVDRRWKRSVTVSRQQFTSAEAAEGMAAFREKRKPQW